MNYVDDDWMNELTPGQTERIWTQVGMFRPQLLEVTDSQHISESGAAVIW